MKAEPTPGISRRDALKTIGAGVMLAGLGGLHSSVRAEGPAAASTGSADEAGSPWALPKLAFAYEALEPHIDAQTMEIHHQRHHGAYISNAKKLLTPHPDLMAKAPQYILHNLQQVPEVIRTGVRNNVGGHVNHSFFWTILAPDAGGEPSNTVGEAIKTEFGSFGEFQSKFASESIKRFGSGWAWLTVKEGKLAISSTANQDSPLTDGATPLLGLDVWEHAYYLHYQNRRNDYITAFWNVVNWTQVDTYYQATLKSS